jgi:hypothetical protein
VGTDSEPPQIDPAWLERQIAAYYAARGWDQEGRPAGRATAVQDQAEVVPPWPGTIEHTGKP